MAMPKKTLKQIQLGHQHKDIFQAHAAIHPNTHQGRQPDVILETKYQIGQHVEYWTVTTNGAQLDSTGIIEDIEMNQPGYVTYKILNDLEGFDHREEDEIDGLVMKKRRKL
jgi:hypothetical protein